MVGLTIIRPKCEQCNIKIPKKHPKLYCSICNKLKHLACQKLTKADANHLLYLQITWTCKECISDILPINACMPSKKNTTVSENKFKVKCSACPGYSYTAKNVRTCYYCEQHVHAKCWNNSLGCVKCCESLIPGFHAYTYELLGDPYLKNDKIYNPYSSSHLTQQIGELIAIEEESNQAFKEASELLVSCKYKIPSIISPADNFELSVFSLNIRTLLNKIANLRDNIEFYEKFDVLLFNETNCKKENLPNGLLDITLEGFYDPIIQDPIRNSGKGGGLAIYVNKRVCIDEDKIVPFSPFSDPENTSGEFQFIKIQECKGKPKTVILGNVYRSPSKTPEKFNKFYENILQKLDTNRYAHKIKVIVGDFNQDLIKHDSDNDCQTLIDNAHNHGFAQIVSRPTRITEHSATLIDHVYTNDISSIHSCNILTLDLSDHLATHTKISLGASTSQAPHLRATKIKTDKSEQRMFNEANHQTFGHLISAETWDGITDDMDAQTAYDKLENIYLKHYNNSYPLKSKRTKRKFERQDPKPWILPWLETACARKQDAYHKFVKTPTTENKAKYDKLNAFCKKHTDIAKINYRKAYFDKYKNDSRKQWLMINSLLNRKSKTSTISKLIDDKGNIINKPDQMANSFNDYFSKIASNLKQKTNPSNADNCESFDKFLKNSVSRTMYLNSVSAGEVHDIIKSFKNKTTRDTKIEALKLANLSFNFTNALAKIINKSFQQGVFPEQMKTARVIPIHKEGSKTDVSNYRPISLLTSFSKIYEKLMHYRILKFLESNNSLCETQYGFRPARSCEHALLNAQNTLLDSLSKRQISLLLLIDFSKAFDMVEHSILLKKLEHYGIRGVALKWMESYLSNRKQFVTVNGSNSTTETIRYGVPQGSILGPLLFIIYINDIPEIAPFAKFILYADDANIILSGESIDIIVRDLYVLIENLTIWVKSNGLALNLKKTKYMIFSRTRNVELPMPLIISNTAIERKTEARFLGVIIDETLNWTRHVKTVLSKMSRYVGIMYKIKKFLPLKARLQIYHSFVQSHLNFCSLVWGFCSKSNIDAIFSKQKKGLRAVIPGFINYKFRDGEIPGHTKSFFSEYKILTIHGIISLNTFIFVHKARKFSSSLPSSIADTISSNSPINESTHETCEEWLKKYDNNIYRNSVFYKGPLLLLSNTIELNLSPASFLTLRAYKNNVKYALLKTQSIGDQDQWENENFILYNIKGLRKSKTEYRKKINYSELLN